MKSNILFFLKPVSQMVIFYTLWSLLLAILDVISYLFVSPNISVAGAIFSYLSGVALYTCCLTLLNLIEITVLTCKNIFYEKDYTIFTAFDSALCDAEMPEGPSLSNFWWLLPAIFLTIRMFYLFDKVIKTINYIIVQNISPLIS